MSTAIFSCSSEPDAEQSVSTAMKSLDRGDYTGARRAVAPLTDRHDLTASQLVRMAIIYMEAGDNLADTQGDDTATALDLYERAVELAPDSLPILFASLPHDRAQYLFMLANISSGLDVDSEGITDEEQTD